MPFDVLESPSHPISLDTEASNPLSACVFDEVIPVTPMDVAWHGFYVGVLLDTLMGMPLLLRAPHPLVRYLVTSYRESMWTVVWLSEGGEVLSLASRVRVAWSAGRTADERVQAASSAMVEHIRRLDELHQNKK